MKKTQRAFRNRFGDRRGYVLVLLAGVLAFLLIAIGYTLLNFGLATTSHNELQAAADDAASAGASMYCSSQSCFTQARTTAVQVLSKLQALSSLGSDPNLNVTSITIPDNQFTWDLSSTSNLVVTVERGLWWNGGVKDGPKFFESMEGSGAGTWTTNHPGIPPFIAANSVRVTITRPHSSFLAGAFSGNTFSTLASSVALKGSTESIPVSPFALPVCALINNGGTNNAHPDYYTAAQMCRGDRYFTRADRFESLPDGYTASGSLVSPGIPGFPWQPCNSIFNYDNHYWDYGMSYFTTEYNQLPPIGLTQFAQVGGGYFTPVIPDGESCALIHGMAMSELGYEWMWGWDLGFIDDWLSDTINGDDANGFGGKHTFPQPDELTSSSERGDEYGVVGIPNFSGLDLETDIVTAFSSSTNPAWEAGVGDTFTVLASGLTDDGQTKGLNGKIWNAVTGSVAGVVVSDSSHVALRDSPMGTIDRTYSRFVDEAFLMVPDQLTSFSWPCDQSSSAYCVMANDPNNSTLQQMLGTPGQTWWLPNISSSEGACNSQWAHFDNFSIQPAILSTLMELPIFFMTADVIKSPGISDDTLVWHVIIPIIADASADAAPCDSEATSGYPIDPQVNPSKQQIIIGFVSGYIYDVDIGAPVPQPTVTYNIVGANNPFSSPPPVTGPADSLSSWGFHAGEITSCNIVRARLDCSGFYVPSADLSVDTQTRIIR